MSSSGSASAAASATFRALICAANAPLAVASVKRTLKSGLAAQVSDITEHELAEQIKMRKTGDASEGLLAVSERRPGKFTGR